MDRIEGIPLLFWLGVTDITSVTRFTSFLASVALSLTSLLELINRHKLFHTTGIILSLIEWALFTCCTYRTSFCSEVSLHRSSLVQRKRCPATKCVLQLPQALLGIRRFFFDPLLLFETISLTGALKLSCVWASFELTNEIDCCVIVRVW